MRKVLILAAMIASPVAARDTRHFECILEKPEMVGVANGEGKVLKIEIDGDANSAWKFSLDLDDQEMIIDWPNTPMQLAGKGPLIQTGPSSFASFLFGKGPCLFTDGDCGAMVHAAEQSNKNLKIQIEPVALTQFEDGHREPFVAFIQGHCEAKEDKQ